MRAMSRLLALLSLSVAGCGPSVATLEPSSKALELTRRNESVALGVLAKDGSGNRMEEAKLAFASSAPKVASVDAAGMVTALATGDAKVTISCGKVKVELPVVVSIPETITFTPPEMKLVGVGAKEAVVATAADSKGRVLKNPKLTWSTNDVKVATISASEVTAQGAGVTMLFAAVGDLRVAYMVRVTLEGPKLAVIEAPGSLDLKVGQKSQLNPVAKDAEGKEISSPGFAYKSDNPKIASVDATGEVTGLSKGHTRVSVKAADKAVAVEVKVKKK